MSTATLLTRLDAVKRTGAGRWIARCSAHADNSPSLAIREIDDGRILLHCFAGCEVEAILTAIGLGWDAIMPPRATDNHVKRERRPFNAHDVLTALNTELTIVSLSALDIGKGKALSDIDRERALLASRRIRTAIELAVEHA